MKEARVVNVRNAHYDVLIDRTTKWGNPWTHVKDRRTRAEHVVATRDEAIAHYGEWIKTQSELLEALPELHGKTLGCWCKPLACHGDVLARLANPDDLGTAVCTHENRIHPLGGGIFVCFVCWTRLLIGP